MKITGIIRTYLSGTESEINIEVESTPRYADSEKHIYEVTLPTPEDDGVLGLFMSREAKFQVDDDNEVWLDGIKVNYRVKEILD